MNLSAADDMNIGSIDETHDARSWSYRKQSGFLSTEKDTEEKHSHEVTAAGATISGDTVTGVSQRDLTITGSTVAATHDVALTAARVLTIDTSQDTAQSSRFHRHVKSGLGSMGGVGVSWGKIDEKSRTHDSTVTQNGSLVGSTQGSVALRAGETLRATGSDLVAKRDIVGKGAEVTIDAARNVEHHDETHEISQSGFTLALKGPAIDAVSNVVDQTRAASRSGDARAAALHGMAAAGGLVDAGLAGHALTKSLADGKKPEGKIELSFGSSHSRNTFAEDGTTNRGSGIQAGGTASFSAGGSGREGSGNLSVAGSKIDANDVMLTAKNRIDLVHTTDTDTTRSASQSSSASVGVSLGTQGWGVSAAMSKAHGDANSDLAMQNNAQVKAANRVTLGSGGDTNLIGAQVDGRQVVADVGGDLNVASVQDRLDSKAHQQSTGGGFDISQGGGGMNFSHSRGHAKGHYAGVEEQSGICVGEGGFDIDVRGNTDLKGAYIAGAEDEGKNRLATGTLTYSDIANHSGYSAHSVGIAGGIAAGGIGKEKTHGMTSGTNAGGILPTFANDSGSEDAWTQSAVGAGRIEIRDGEAQKQDLAGLKRETEGLNGKVSKTPDVQQLLGDQADLMSAIQAAAETVAKNIGRYADSRQDAALQAGNKAEAEKWAEGGAYRVAMHTAGGALTGGIGAGGLAGALGGGIGAGVSAGLAGQLKSVSDAVTGARPTGNEDLDRALGNLVANALAGTAGGVVGGGMGATMGAGVDRFNRQLHEEEKQAIAGKADGDKAEQDRLTKAACLAVKCWAQYPAGSDEYNNNYVSQLEATQLQPEIDWVNRQKEAGLFDYTPGQKIGDMVKSDPVGVAKDAAKVFIGGATAKTGGGLCTTGVGCVAGGWMAAFGMSEVVEGGSGLYNRYNGINSSGDNPLRWGFNQVLSNGWGNIAYNGFNFAFSVAALRAPVPLNMGVADGLNRPVSIFGVTVSRIDNVNLLPFIKQPWPNGTTQGALLLGVGTKGGAVINDIRNAGEHK